MGMLEIDSRDGSVLLPCGFTLGPALSQEAFMASEPFAVAQRQDYGTHPWIHYRFSGGSIEGGDLITVLCFYDQLLVYAHLTVDLYPPGSKDWSSYSLQVELDTKRCHERILGEILGAPTEPAPDGVLDVPCRWVFPWGHVTSTHDAKGGGTYIIVGYGDRLGEANRAFRAGRRLS